MLKLAAGFRAINLNHFGSCLSNYALWCFTAEMTGRPIISQRYGLNLSKSSCDWRNFGSEFGEPH